MREDYSVRFLYSTVAGRALLRLTSFKAVDTGVHKEE